MTKVHQLNEHMLDHELANDFSKPDHMKANFEAKAGEGTAILEETKDNTNGNEKIQDQPTRYRSSLISQLNTKNYEFRYLYPILLTFNACLCAFYVGYNLGVFDTMQANLTHLFGWDEDTQDIYISVISSSVLVGAVVGSLTSGPILRIFGRKNSFLIYNVIAVIGLAMSIITNEYLIICGRALAGISAGAFSSSVPIYVNEFVPYKISGACGVSIEMAYALGISISYVLGLGLPKPETQDHEDNFWRVMFLFPTILLVINQACLFFYFKYETPKYLVLKKRKPEAIQALRQIYLSEDDINHIIENIEKLEESSSDGSVSFRQLLSKSYRKRFFIGIIACWGQQSNGIDTLIFYSNKIFGNNVDHDEATKLTIILGFVLFAANILTIFVVERFGRRKILIFGHLVSLLSLVGIVVCYVYDLFTPIKVLFILFVFITGLTVAPVSYVYTSDILPESGMGVAVMVNYITTILVVQTFPFLIKSWLQIPGSLSIFALTSLVMTITVLLFFKETKGRSPRDIEKLFR